MRQIAKSWHPILIGGPFKFGNFIYIKTHLYVGNATNAFYKCYVLPLKRIFHFQMANRFEWCVFAEWKKALGIVCLMCPFLNITSISFCFYAWYVQRTLLSAHKLCTHGIIFFLFALMNKMCFFRRFAWLFFTRIFFVSFHFFWHLLPIAHYLMVFIWILFSVCWSLLISFSLFMAILSPFHFMQRPNLDLLFVNA